MAIKSEAHLGRQDKLLEFGETNTITAAATYPCGYSADSTDGVRLDLGKSDLEGMSVIFHVSTALAGSGVKASFKVSVSDNGTTWNEIAVSPAFAVTELTENKEFVVPIPRGHAQGHLMKAEVVSTGTATAGKVSAYIDTYIGK